MTAKEIRDGLKGEGRVYYKQVFAEHPKRVFDARIRKGSLQVKTVERWHDVLYGDQIWAVGQ